MEFDLAGTDSALLMAKHILEETESNGKDNVPVSPKKRKRNKVHESEEQERDTDDEDEELSESRVHDSSLDDKSAASRKYATHWIQNNFQHNPAPNYTGLSKDFVYQLYRHCFSPDLPFLSVGQFTRLFNEIMYKDMEFNPRARKTPSSQVIHELYPLTNIGVDFAGKHFGNKERRITYFPKVCLNPTIKDLKESVVNNDSFTLQSFIESLRTYKKRVSDAKPKLPKQEDLIEVVGSQIAYRVYMHDKYLVLAVDLPGIDPSEIDISFPTESSVRLAHKDGIKTYEEKVLLENNQFALVSGRKKGNLLTVPLEIQLPVSVDIPYPSSTTTPFIHDHFGTIVFKFEMNQMYSRTV